MKSSTFILIALLFFAFTLEAQVTFTASEGPTGASIGDVEINSNGIIFVLAGREEHGSTPSDGTVYRSTDNGANWTKLSGTGGLTDSDANDILIDADNNIYVLGKNKIYKSLAASNGSNWQVREPGAPFVGGDALAKTSDGELYLVNTTEGIFRSVDDGITWVNVSTDLPNTDYGAITTIGNDVYLSVLNSGTYRALDPDSDTPHWVDFNDGMILPDQPESFLVKGSTLYQSSRAGVFYHNGSTWVQIAYDSDFSSGVNFNGFNHKLFNGEDDRIYLTFYTGPLYYFDSTTGGTWPEVPDVNISTIYDLETLGSLIVIGYSREGVSVSTNSGANWSPANNGIYKNFTSAFVQTDDGRLITADYSSHLQISQYGTNWERIKPDGSCTNCSFSGLVKLGNGDVLAIGNYVYKSVDNGESWTLYSTPPEHLSDAWTTDDVTFYAYKNNHPSAPTFYYSDDGAFSWSEVTFSGLPSSYEMRNLTVDDSNNFFIFLRNGSTSENELYMVPEGSTAATKITTHGFSQGIDNVRYADGAIYVLGRNGSNQRQIARSTDAGANWTRVNVRDLSDFYPMSSEIIVGMDGNGSTNQILYTNNGGTTWTTAFHESNQARFIRAVLEENGYVTLAFSEAPVYRSNSSVVRPNAPVNLQAIATGESEIFLEWDHDGQNVESFIILKRLNGTISFDTVEAQASSSERYHQVYGLTKNTDYEFRVLAESVAGTSASASTSGSTNDDCALTIPDNRSWTGTVAGGFTNAQIGIKRYNGNLYGITDVTAGSLAAVPRNSGGTFGEATVPTFFYENCGEPFIDGTGSVFANGNGSWDGTTLTLHFQIDKAEYTPTELTMELTLNSEDPAPGPVLNPIAYVYDNNSVRVEWQSNLYQHTYKIYRGTTAGFTPSEDNKVGEVSYPDLFFIDDGPLTYGLTYYYRIRAFNADPVPESSTFSEVVSVIFNKPMFVPSGTLVSNTTANAPTAAWADFNNDGLEDIMMPEFSSDLGSGEGTLLFENTGTDFQLVSGKFPSGVSYVTPSIGDYDNDGLTDVYMASIRFDEGETPEKYSLFRNTGDFNFSEQTVNALSTAEEEGAFVTSWVDVDNDGALDLFVVNQMAGKQSLFQGDGSGGFTKNLSTPLVTDNARNTYAAWTDLDKNGYQDVILINSDDGESGGDAFRLFKNEAGTFNKVEIAALNADDNAEVFTCSWGDYDNDLDMDLFAGNQEGAGLLYRNNGNETFTKIAEAINTPTEETSSGTFSSSWGDIDNDGDLDLIVTKGFYAGNCLYINQGNGTFTKVQNELITDAPGFHLSASFADYNKDGFLDLLVGQLVFSEGTLAGDEPTIKLMKNNNSAGNWVEIKLIGTVSNASAIGARIIVTTGTKSQMREITSHSGFGSQNSLIAHFGLGTATTIDNIEIVWPSGAVQNLTGQPINTFLEITEDVDGPAASALIPANNATAVSTTTQISITLNEVSTAVSDKLLLLYLHSDMSNPILGLPVTEAELVDNTYTFTLDEKLLPGTRYNISVDAGAFVDQYGNGSLEFPTGHWTFTTAAAPTASAFSPEHEETGVSLNAPLVITFDNVVEPVAGKTIKVMDGTTQVLSVDVSSIGELVSTTTSIYTLTPEQKWPAGRELNVMVDAGAFVGAASQADFAGIVSGTWTFTTASAPGFTLSPTPDQGNVLVTSPLEIVFDKVVEAVAGKKLKVMDGASTLIDIDVSLAGTLESTSSFSTYTFQPETDFPAHTILKVTIDPGAFIDPATQAEFAGISVDEWNFTTEAGPDELAPTISFTQSQVPQALESGFAAIAFSVSVTDDRQVSSVTLHHRKVSTKDFTALPLTFNSSTSNWDGQITSTFSDEMGFQYYFEAADPAGNIGRFPVQDDTYLMSTISYASNPPIVQLPTAGTKTSWKVIAIPYILQSTQITTVFAELGDADKSKWRLIRYAEDPGQVWKEYPTHFSTLERGKGYFINTKDISSVAIEGASAPNETRDNLFSMTLAAGWNQVGNPYTVAINWEDVRSFNETVTIGELKIFNSGSYTNGDELVPFQGGFVFTENAATIEIPFKGQTSGGRKGVKDLSNDIDTDDWMVSLTLEQGELHYDLGAVGMATDASDSYDRYDDVTPPRFLDYLEVNFAHPEHRARMFTRDIVTTDDNHSWEFNVESNQVGEAQLLWDRAVLASATNEIYLLDAGRQTLVNMKEKGSYSFNPKESATFKVIFGRNLEIAPQAVHLGIAYPNPTSGQTVMGFSLPKSGGYNQSVSLEIVDITGKKVGTVAHGRFDPGYHELTWNAGELNNGFYTYRLNVQGLNGKTVKTNKLIIK